MGGGECGGWAGDGNVDSAGDGSLPTGRAKDADEIGGYRDEERRGRGEDCGGGEAGWEGTRESVDRLGSAEAEVEVLEGGEERQGKESEDEGERLKGRGGHGEVGDG